MKNNIVHGWYFFFFFFFWDTRFRPLVVKLKRNEINTLSRDCNHIHQHVYRATWRQWEFAAITNLEYEQLFKLPSLIPVTLSWTTITRTNARKLQRNIETFYWEHNCTNNDEELSISLNWYDINSWKKDDSSLGPNLKRETSTFTIVRLFSLEDVFSRFQKCWKMFFVTRFVRFFFRHFIKLWNK